MPSPITCHVLDSSTGKPAAGVLVQVDKLRGQLNDLGEGDDFVRLAGGTTNDDGRLAALVNPSHILQANSVYRVTFLTGRYFARQGQQCFHPRVEIIFKVSDPPEKHYHVPLLLSPFGYTTYRGS